MELNKIHTGDCHELMKVLPSNSVHCIVTSPPYYLLRDYGHEGQIGLEKSHGLYIKKITEVFLEAKRVLRKDGTLWLNIGDSYAGSMNGMQKNGGDEWKANSRNLTARKDCGNYEVLKNAKSKRGRKGDGIDRWGGGNVPAADALKPKDLIGIPWRMAFALQGIATVPMVSFSEWANILKEAREKEDWELVLFVENILRSQDLLSELKQQGWYLRQDIIWHKPNPMPESVQDRCTKSHEYVFLLSKSPKYFYDIDAIRTPIKDSTAQRMMQQIQNQKGSERVPGKPNGPMKAVGPGRTPAPHDSRGGNQGSKTGIKAYSHRGEYADKNLSNHSGYLDANGDIVGDGMSNKKSVWIVSTKPFTEAHFATFPQDLIFDCIKAGTSEAGCCSVCEAPLKRVSLKKLVPTKKASYNSKVDQRDVDADPQDHGSNRAKDGHMPGHAYALKTLGWEPSCKCNADIKPCVVLDPFMGAGTTAIVARKLHRNFIGFELNPKYVKMANKRMTKELGLFI